MTTKDEQSKDGARRYVLTSSQIAQMPGKAKVHYLNEGARRTNKSLGDATGLTGFGIHHIEIPVGADSTEYHLHHDEDECLYVLEGKAVATINDESFELEAGDFVGLPAGGPLHVFHNPGPELLRCLVVGQRLAHDVCDYPRVGKRLYRHGEHWDLVDIEHIEDPRAAPGSTVGSK